MTFAATIPPALPDCDVELARLPILQASSLALHFGGVYALDGASFEFGRGEIVAMIGPNGSGKTTACNVLSGHLTPQSGSVVFKQRAIDGLPAYRVARRGIARTFQDVRVFRRFTAMENMLFSLRSVGGETIWRAAIGAVRRHRWAGSDVEEAKHWLESAGLTEKKDTLARDLSFGQAKLLEIVRAACRRPELILFDEPAAGLSVAGLERLARVIERLRDRKTTIGFIEHNLRVVRQFADRVLVFDTGRVVASGKPEMIERDAFVRRIYTGAPA